jgi:hypothetical protein
MLFSGCALVQGGTWQSIGPEQGGVILSLATDPFDSHLIYVGSSTGIVYVASADAGPNLVPGVGIPRTALITALLADPAHKGTIYAGTSAGLYVSSDHSMTWRPRGTGFPAGETMDALAYAAASVNILFAGSGAHGVFASHDQGNTWVAAGTGLPANADINALLFLPVARTLYAAVDAAGVYASTDLGATWSKRGVGLPESVNALTDLSTGGLNAKGVTLYAGTSQGIYASVDEGGSWSLSGGSKRQPIYCLATYPPLAGWIYAGTETDVVRSADGGHTWATVAPGLSHRVLAVASVTPTPSSSAPAYVIYAAAADLWRFPSEQGGAASALSVLIVGGILVAMFGLPFYFVRRARRLLDTTPPPAPARPGGGAARSVRSGSSGQGGGAKRGDEVDGWYGRSGGAGTSARGRDGSSHPKRRQTPG